MASSANVRTGRFSGINFADALRNGKFDRPSLVKFFQEECGLALMEALHAANVVSKHLQGQLNTKQSRSKKGRKAK